MAKASARRPSKAEVSRHGARTAWIAFHHLEGGGPRGLMGLQRARAKAHARRRLAKEKIWDANEGLPVYKNMPIVGG
jgi:hypothetical protein